MSDQKEERFQTIRINHLLLLACDKYIYSIVNKCDFDIRNWMEVFKDVTADLCYIDGKVSSDNINNNIVPKIKLIHVYFCDFIFKLINNKYPKKEKYLEDISEIKKLIKIIKKDIKSDELDNLSRIIEAISNSEDIVAALRNEYENILILFEKYITFYFDNCEKSEIYIKNKDFETTEGFINFLDNLTDKWIKENTTIEPKSDLLLVKKDKIYKKPLAQQNKENYPENYEYQDDNINKSSQKLNKHREGDWTENEIDNLIEGIKEYGIDKWPEILKKYNFENRTNNSLAKKYYRIIETHPDFLNKISKLNKSNKRKLIHSIYRNRYNKWSDDQINYLREGIKEFGVSKWSKIVKKYFLGNRTADSLCKKYKEILNRDSAFFEDCKSEKKSKK